jgi:hypothetical protein
MPVFTSAIAGAIALTAGIGLASYAAGGGFGDIMGGEDKAVDTRIASATGQLTEEEAQTAAKKRAYRSGVLFTSPTGLNSSADTASAKLK